MAAHGDVRVARACHEGRRDGGVARARHGCGNSAASGSTRSGSRTSRTSRAARGSGLAIVRQTVFAHDGAVEARSTQGAGTEIADLPPDQRERRWTDSEEVMDVPWRTDTDRARSSRSSIICDRLCRSRERIARSAWSAQSLQPKHSARRCMARLERMEQAIDSIAVEVERISEGQRFTTKLLERAPASPGAAAEAAASESMPRGPDRRRRAEHPPDGRRAAQRRRLRGARRAGRRGGRRARRARRSRTSCCSTS